MGGWGREAILVAPNGDVLPCQSASIIPGMVFDNVREVIFQTDTKGNWLLLNPAWTEITGFSVAVRRIGVGG